MSGVHGVGLASPGLSWRFVQSVPSAVLPVRGGVGGCVPVGRVDQCPLPLSLQVLQRCNGLQGLRLAAADCRSVRVLLGPLPVSEDRWLTRPLCLCRFLSRLGLSPVPRLVGESRDEGSLWRFSEEVFPRPGFISNLV